MPVEIVVGCIYISNDHRRYSFLLRVWGKSKRAVAGVLYLVTEVV